MEFNYIDKLKKEEFDFISNLNSYEYKKLIHSIKNSPQKIDIINTILPKLKDILPKFCFEIICDIDDYIEDSKYILDNYYDINSIDIKQFEKILNNGKVGFYLLDNNFDYFIDKFKNNLYFIFKFLFNNHNDCFNMLKKLSNHSNLHTRYLFMKYLIERYPQLIDLFYDDITKYLTDDKDNYMDVKDVSELAYLIFENDIDYNTWNDFKQFIFNNYKYNDLAYRLLNFRNVSYNYDHNKNINEFNKDASKLFDTSINYRFNILNKYSENVSKELLRSYKKELSYFNSSDKVEYIYRNIELFGLSRQLFEYVDKYLSISNDKTHSFIDVGSTASCYRIGDYVFKLVKTKWSYEDVICPNLYIILPNLEEVFIRDDDGIVLAGIEVQKYLPRSANNLPPYVFSEFMSELNRLGYYTTDTLINGKCGDNCRLLNSYIESGNLNPPDWFKLYPLVLIDRDRIYKKTNPFPKQLKNNIYLNY